MATFRSDTSTLRFDVSPRTGSPDGKVAGLTNPDGTCNAPLVKVVNSPMIHVWIQKHPCGPFAALEGIGGGTIAKGETKLCDHAHGSGL
jgi:hypothetical protein